MKNLATVALMLVVASLASYSSAHSGRTDSSGGHNCSQKSINKGLCSGYHYHNNTSINQPKQFEIEVSVAPEKDHKADKKHSQDQHIHDSQEG
ncbi:YHYH domain-containing protein [Porticoccaceae bacterium]|jgi:hypothetical protein|nr:YHYH domain-containing protein [Porticoccaceae bacterium]